jgi:tetrahydromethanopterin S-methyltransferase subunit B
MQNDAFQNSNPITSSLSTGLISGIVIGLLILLIAIAIDVAFYRRRAEETTTTNVEMEFELGETPTNPDSWMESDPTFVSEEGWLEEVEGLEFGVSDLEETISPKFV